ncbi:MAG: UDP-glucose 4-epimerase GalE [Bacteroidetes bacterium]|nr:MAG: UDP-glucose 4-epimerase GalE [Bacteroidota bacterium]MBL1144649.1 UDP-glucose 4-epimerase GalE [Bacteroidota bacterium]MCB0802191.1 UDP-glucose 4-epimerase GalE [Flavobacteriales bacterium]NOG57444.1 UDP-glucose 4-epimerase GalE [Bacteroidota bacterium]
MKILVTGGAGYIGSHTIIELFNRGYKDIVSVDNYLNSSEIEYGKLAKILGVKVSYKELDLANESECLEFLKSNHFDAIIHFAALKSVPESVEMPVLYYKNNLNALLNILQGMKENHIKKIIFSSSCSVYGNPNILPVTEATPFGRAESPYAHTKQIGENIIQSFCKANPQIKALSLRYFNPAGAHISGLIGEVKTKRPNNLVPIIAQNAIGMREKFTVFGTDFNTKDGSCIRDYIHVSDIADAHVLAMEFLDRMDTNYDVFNLGSGSGSTTLEVVNAFEKLKDVELNYEIGPRRDGDVETIYANNAKAKELLNWSPKHDLHDIVSTAWAWQQNA